MTNRYLNDLYTLDSEELKVAKSKNGIENKLMPEQSLLRRKKANKLAKSCGYTS